MNAVVWRLQKWTRVVRVARHAATGATVVLIPGLATACALAWPAQHAVAPPPASFAVETVSIASSSGSTLRAWLARGKPEHGAVLLLHGAHEDRTSMLARARFLHARGFTVLAPDFQAHGESPGKRITFGARESRDAAAAFQFLRDAAPAERIGVIGVSMGGAAALLGQGPLAANAFVLESVYPTIRDATRDRLGVWFGPFGVVGRSLTPAFIAVVGRSAGVTEAELRPIDRIDEIRAPLLLLNGTRDRYTPLAEAESLYARAPGPKSFWAIAGGTHGDLHRFATDDYEHYVGDFLATHLTRRATATAAAVPASRDSATLLRLR